MNPQYTTGIQTLLEAEKRALEIVNQAKRNKAKALKDSVGEAEKEMENFRQQRELEFTQWKLAHAENTDDATLVLKGETEQRLKDVQTHIAANSEAVVQLLLDAVADIRPSPHQNLKVEQSQKKKMSS